MTISFNCSHKNNSFSSKEINYFKLLFFKFLILFSLFFMSVICGIGTYSILSSNENKNKNKEYSSLCKQYKERFQESINIKVLSMNSLSKMISLYCYSSYSWPNCSIPISGFTQIADPIIQLSAIRGVSFSPILSINQIQSFESFAYSFFQQQGYPNLGLSPSFGKGIYSIDNITNQRYHDIGQHIIGKRSISVPVFEIAKLNNNEAAVMLNLYSEINRAQMIDKLIDCHELGGQGRDCTTITNIISLVQDTTFRPSSLLAFPITPLNNPENLVGITVQVLNWDTVISDSALDIDNIIIVLTSPDKINYSYKIKNGQAIYLGIGDFHDKKYSHRQSSFSICLTNNKSSPITTTLLYDNIQNNIQNKFNHGNHHGNVNGNSIDNHDNNKSNKYHPPPPPPNHLFDHIFSFNPLKISNSNNIINNNNINIKNNDDEYTISIYPTEEYLSQFESYNPIYITTIAVGIVVFTSIIFLVYDFFVKADATEKESTINSKRLFVRYIGHEIRTPLNTVHLGTKLLIDEIQQTYQDFQNNPNSYSIKSIMEYFSEWIHLAHEVESSSDTAITVLNDLLDYDKISGGGLKIELEPVSLWDLVYKSVNPFNVQAKHAGINLILDLAILRKVSIRNMDIDEKRKEQMSKLAVLGDPIKLSHVVRNLVSNALKFTPKGGTITVQVYWDEQPLIPNSPPHTAGINKIIPHPYRSEGKEGSEHSVINSQTTISPDCHKAGTIICIVTDTGYGMTSEQLKNLFQEGMQFNANKLQGGGGSGLGLWIAKGVVSLHNGTLTAKSDGEGKGSSFTLELPVYLMPSPLYNVEEAIKLHRLQELTLIESNPIDNLLLTSDIIQSTNNNHNINHNNNNINMNSNNINININNSSNSSNSSNNISIPITARSNLSQRDINLSTYSNDNDRPISMSSTSNVDIFNPVVLVVDDVASSRKIVCRLLRKEGCICYEAVDGQECLDMIELHGIQSQSEDAKDEIDLTKRTNSSSIYPPFDLIFLDYEMPRIDGPNTARIIRQKGYQIPIIGLTGNVMDEDTEYFIKNGVSTVLHKPLTINSMHHCLEVYGPKKTLKYSLTTSPPSLPLTSLSEGYNSERVHQISDEQEEYRV